MVALSACGKDNPQPTTITQASGTGAAISGTVNQSGNCSQNPVTIAVYSGQSVVQQSSVNIGASFSFQVSPGTYTVGAQNTSGCGAQQPVSVTQGQTGSVNLTLVQGGQYTPTGQYPGQYPNTYPSSVPGQYPGGYPSGYPYNQYPNTYPYGYNPYGGYNPYNPFVQVPSWAPAVQYPYIYMYGQGGTGYYTYGATGYTGPCRYGNSGGWICGNTF